MPSSSIVTIAPPSFSWVAPSTLPLITACACARPATAPSAPMLLATSNVRNVVRVIERALHTEREEDVVRCLQHLSGQDSLETARARELFRPYAARGRRRTGDRPDPPSGTSDRNSLP